MEEKLESERILGIKHFCKAFRYNATVSEAANGENRFYVISTKSFDELEKEYTRRSYGKK